MLIVEFKSAVPMGFNEQGNGVGNIIRSEQVQFKPESTNYTFRGWILDQLNTEMAQKIGTGLSLGVWVEVTPAGIDFRIGGEGFVPKLSITQQPENVWAVSTGAPQLVGCTSDPIPDTVGISKDSIKWGIAARACDPKKQAGCATVPAQTGPHEIFRTLDVPIDEVEYVDNRGVIGNKIITIYNGATAARMRKACELGAGGTIVADTVLKVFERFPLDPFNPGKKNDLDYWDFFSGVDKDCDSMAACFMLVCSLLGVKDGAVAFIYPTSKDDCIKGDQECLKQKFRPDGNGKFEVLKFTVPGGATNEYQGCAKIAGEYWSLHPKIHSATACGVLKQLFPPFAGQLWFYFVPNPNNPDEGQWKPVQPPIPVVPPSN